MDETVSKAVNLFYQTTNLGRLIISYEEYKNLFKVGDIVNLVEHPGHIASFEDGLPKRYKVVFVDEHGQAWMRRISRKKGLTKRILSPIGVVRNCSPEELESLTAWGETRIYTKIQLDAEYITSILLGFKFNPRAIYKKSKIQSKKKKGRYV